MADDTGNPIDFTLLAVVIPQEVPEPIVMAPDTLDVIVDIFITAMTPTLNILILSEPPKEVIHEVMETLATAQISFFVTTTMFSTGGKPPDWVRDSELMSAFSDMLLPAMWARMEIILDELLARQAERE